MPTVSFKLSELKNIAEHARTAPERRACLSQQLDRNIWKDEYKDQQLSDMDVLTKLGGKQVDESKIPKGFWLVKDRGIYLLSNGVPLDKKSDDEMMNLCYANGCNPSVNSDWYHAARAKLGGDDGVFYIPLDFYDLSVERGKRTLSIKVTASAFSLVL